MAISIILKTGIVLMPSDTAAAAAAISYLKFPFYLKKDQL
jgi:hypothetical protein